MKGNIKTLAHETHQNTENKFHRIIVCYPYGSSIVIQREFVSVIHFNIELQSVIL